MNESKKIFTTPLWVWSTNLSKQELNDLREIALNNEVNGSSVKASNNDFAFHTSTNFHGSFQKLPGAQKLAMFFKKCLDEYGYKINSVNVSYWSIISRKYSFNSRHNHGDSLLSSALYISVPEHSGEIKFHDPRPGKLMSNMIGIDLNNVQHQAIKVTPCEGMLVVFPSFLEHEVTMTLSDEPRIIYSFNITPIAA
jgi:uncharacterized protein (TIGR02466 family)